MTFTNSKQPQCTPEKEKAIMDAFKHFQMICSLVALYFVLQLCYNECNKKEAVIWYMISADESPNAAECAA